MGSCEEGSTKRGLSGLKDVVDEPEVEKGVLPGQNFSFLRYNFNNECYGEFVEFGFRSEFGEVVDLYMQIFPFGSEFFELKF